MVSFFPNPQRWTWRIPPLLILLALLGSAPAQPAALQDRFVLTSDHVRLHCLEAGPPTGNTILFIPGWTMPAWIWRPQIQAFAARYRVVALDPRGQGESDIPLGGYEPARRGEDIADVIAQLGPAPVLLVGWSLGVLDTLSYVHENGDARIAGLVLVDNSVGEDPPPAPLVLPHVRGPPLPRAVLVRRFVQSMFRHPQTEAYLEQLTEASLRTPEYASRALLAYPVPRSYWREAVYSTDKPLLYAVRPKFAAQAANLERGRPGTETALFTDAGHALFVDDAARFNSLLDGFIRRRIWR